MNRLRQWTGKAPSPSKGALSKANDARHPYEQASANGQARSLPRPKAPSRKQMRACQSLFANVWITSRTCQCRARAHIRLLKALAHDVTRHYRARSHIRLLEALAHDVKGLRPQQRRHGKTLKDIILGGRPRLKPALGGTRRPNQAQHVHSTFLIL